MTKLEQIQKSPLTVPVYQHSSEIARSKEQAGGQVPVDQYANKAPGMKDERR